MSATICTTLLLLSSMHLLVRCDQAVSYFSWFPATEHKTITFIPSMVFERAEQMCYKMRGRLLTFNLQEITSINNDLRLLFGPNEYWVGIVREMGSIPRWSDGSYIYPAPMFNISYNNDQSQGRLCGAVQVMSGYNNYMVQMSNCNMEKKAICESWQTIGLFGILSITALVLTALCLIIVSVVLVRSFIASKSAASTYVMKTSGRNVDAE